jgi:hypothetical protein
MKQDKKCWECNVMMKEKLVDYELFGIRLGKFPALVCKKCGDVLFSEETSDKICRIAKKKGLWGLQARTRIGEAGKTLDVRFPKRLIDFFDLKKGEEVTLTPEGKKKIVITL